MSVVTFQNEQIAYFLSLCLQSSRHPHPSLQPPFALSSTSSSSSSTSSSPRSSSPSERTVIDRQSDGAGDVWDERQGRLLIGSRGGEEKEDGEEEEEEVGGGKESVILTAAELFMMPQSQTSKSGRKTSQHLLSFFSFFTLPPSFPPSTFVFFPGEGGSPTSASLFKLVPLLTREEDRKWLQSFSPNPFLAASINKK